MTSRNYNSMFNDSFTQLNSSFNQLVFSSSKSSKVALNYSINNSSTSDLLCRKNGTGEAVPYLSPLDFEDDEDCENYFSSGDDSLSSVPSNSGGNNSSSSQDDGSGDASMSMMTTMELYYVPFQDSSNEEEWQDWKNEMSSMLEDTTTTSKTPSPCITTNMTFNKETFVLQVLPTMAVRATAEQLMDTSKSIAKSTGEQFQQTTQHMQRSAVEISKRMLQGFQETSKKSHPDVVVSSSSTTTKTTASSSSNSVLKAHVQNSSQVFRGTLRKFLPPRIVRV